MGVLNFENVLVDYNSSKYNNMTSTNAKEIVERDNHCLTNASAINLEEREEGEIVDDYEYELILSSEDEEYSLRERIKELEATNKELEQIAKISGSYANQYKCNLYNNSSTKHPIIQRNKRKNPRIIVSDASSISSGEFETPKKKKKRRRAKHAKTKESYFGSKEEISSYGKNLEHRSPYFHYDSKYSFNYKKRHRNLFNSEKYNIGSHQKKVDIISLGSCSTLSDNTKLDSDNDCESTNLEELQEFRNELRFALARDTIREAPGGSLRERLYHKTNEELFKTNITVEQQSEQSEQFESKPIEAEKCEEQEAMSGTNPSSESDVSEGTEEQELRLIALKSAVLKKHYARKKRDAEMAYSPTDFISKEQYYPTSESDLTDIQEIIEISPATSPERSSCNASVEFSVDTKPVDMDIATTDSDDRSIDNFTNFSWQPIHAMPVIRQPNNFKLIMPNFSCVQNLFQKSDSLTQSVALPQVESQPQLKTQTQLETQPELKTQPQPLTPPSLSPAQPKINSCALDELDMSHLSYRSASSEKSENTNDKQIKGTKQLSPIIVSSDEEEVALRALLLSKFQNQNQMKSKTVKENSFDSNRENLNVKSITSNYDDSENEDPELLRIKLLSNMPVKKTKQNNIAVVLKDAVKRIESQCDKYQAKYQNCELPMSNGLIDLTEDMFNSANAGSPKLMINLVEQNAEHSNNSDITQDSILTPKHSNGYKLKNATLNKNKTTIAPIDLINATQSKKVPHSTVPMTLRVSASPAAKIIKPKKIVTTTASPLNISKVNNNGQVPSIKGSSSTSIRTDVDSLHFASSRLITKANLNEIKVNRLIISLRKSDSETDYEMNSDSESELQSEIVTQNHSSISAADNPTCAAVPTESVPAIESQQTALNKFFEQRLDDFLKQARSKVELNKALIEEKQKQKLPSPTKTECKVTPMAVRHLPASSQEEYRQLIQRMQMLEKRKETRIKSSKCEQPAPKLPHLNAPTANKIILKQVIPEEPVIATNNAVTVVQNVNSEVSKSNAQLPVNKTPIQETAQAATQTRSDASNSNMKIPLKNIPKSVNDNLDSTKNRLRHFEDSYKKIGHNMIANLNKSLKMVEDAKSAKIARLRYGHRLRELQIQMEKLKQNMKLEQTKITKIQPKIQSSHDIIISLKKKRNNLYKSAMDLGKNIDGPEYRLIDDSKTEIVDKSSQLSNEIKLVNSLVTYSDIIKLKASEAPSSNTKVNDKLISRDANSEQKKIKPGVGTSSKTENVNLQIEKGNQNTAGESLLKVKEDMAAREVCQSVFTEVPQSDVLVNENTTSIDTTLDLKRKENDLIVSDARPVTIAKPDSIEGAQEEVTALTTGPARAIEEGRQIGQMLQSPGWPKPIPPTFQTQNKYKNEQTNTIEYDTPFFKELTETKDACTNGRPKRFKALIEYKSPWPLMACNGRHLDPNGLLCPFDLQGQCKDVDCSFVHL